MADSITPFPPQQINSHQKPYDHDRWRWMKADPALAELIREDQELWDEFDAEEARHERIERDIDRRHNDLRRRINQFWDDPKNAATLHALVKPYQGPDNALVGMPGWLELFWPEWDGEDDEG